MFEKQLPRFKSRFPPAREWRQSDRNLCHDMQPAPLPSGGRGLGRGWLYGLRKFNLA